MPDGQVEPAQGEEDAETREETEIAPAPAQGGAVPTRPSSR